MNARTYQQIILCYQRGIPFRELPVYFPVTSSDLKIILRGTSFLNTEQLLTRRRITKIIIRKMLLEGKSYRQIAKKLGIPYKTLAYFIPLVYTAE